ncbi:MAG: D-alanyl-D-alanine carboxypeptidase [Clostridia bacterium]|nr:D-alanyl-D-alanine carboxypeptidase [Clostridia bacterium]
MKKTWMIAVILLLAVLVGTVPAAAGFDDQKDATAGLQSKIYYMVSLDDGTQMFGKNEDQPTAPAAFVKILSAVTAIEAWENLDETVEITSEALSLVKYDYGARTANLTAGDTYTRRQLIDAMMVYSANDAANVIAYEIDGTVEAYTERMNKVAKAAGCENTNVVNLSGFDAEGQTTTARDVAALIRYALDKPVFASIFSAKQVTLPATENNSERTYSAENKMMLSSYSDYYLAAVTGGRQTSTTNAGECIAVTSTMNGYNYLTVVMGGKMSDIDNDGANENTALTDAKQLLSWTYDNVRYSVIARAGQTIRVINVENGKNSDTLRLVPESETSALVLAKANSDAVAFELVDAPESVKAPVKAGTVICQAKIKYADKEIMTINLVAANDVKLGGIHLVMEKLRSLLTSKVFIVLEIIALLGVLGYLGLMFMNQQQKKRPALRRVPNAPADRMPPQRRTAKPQSAQRSNAQRRPGPARPQPGQRPTNRPPKR